MNESLDENLSSKYAKTSENTIEALKAIVEKKKNSKGNRLNFAIKFHDTIVIYKWQRLKLKETNQVNSGLTISSRI